MPQVYNPFTDDRAQAVVTAYRSGATVKGIAADLGCHPLRVSRTLHAAGITPEEMVAERVRRRIRTNAPKYPLGSVPSEIDLAYIAGFFDGEGTIGKSNGRWRVSIAQQDEAPLRWMQDAFGCGSIHRHGSCSAYRLSSDLRVHDFLVLVRPFLKVKMTNADAALVFFHERYGWPVDQVVSST